MPAEPFVHWDDADLPEGPLLEDPAAVAASQARFPRSRVELAILEILRHWDPLELTPVQVAMLVHAPLLDVRRRLQALAMLGTVNHRRRGYYQHRRREEAERD
jgi:hypothetical protein